MPTSPRVSVVVPTYNGARYLAATLGSVLAQTMADLELVVVDDGSADESPAIARAAAGRDARVRLVRQANAGIAAARNRGASEADPGAGAVLFLDHDDLLAPDALAALADALDAHAAWVGAHGLARFLGADGTPDREGRAEAYTRGRRAIVGGRSVAWPRARPTTFACLALRCWLITVGQVLVRRTVLDTLSRFDPAAVPADDWEFWVRLASRGDLGFLDRVVVDYREHAGRVSRDQRAMAEATMRLSRAFAARPWPTAQQQRIAAAAPALLRRDNGRLRRAWAMDALRRGRPVDAAKHARHMVADLAAAAIGG